jgi:hypothetical protein
MAMTVRRTTEISADEGLALVKLSGNAVVLEGLMD